MSTRMQQRKGTAEQWTNVNPILAEGQEAPMLRQPHYPNQDAFDTKAEAEGWAQQWILAKEDDSADLPGDNPSSPTLPRPSISE